MTRGRIYGRQYFVQWDSEVRRYHVTLGKESIGFHLTQEGAKALAVFHAHQASVGKALQPFAIAFGDNADRGNADNNHGEHSAM